MASFCQEKISNKEAALSVYAFTCLQITRAFNSFYITWFLQVRSLQFIIEATNRHIFFVSFSLVWQCLMFYTGTERIHLEQLGNGQWISLENESIARQMVKWTLTSYLEHRLRHLFFVSFSLESQCLMFYACTEKDSSERA